jgi:5-methylcytosine-specific restriction endonuclease McrA
MDKEYIKTIISSKNEKDDRLIKENDLIDAELVKIFCSTKRADVARAFYSYENQTNPPRAYRVEVICPNCGKKNIKALSKTRTLDMINRGDTSENMLCEKCKAEKEAKIEAEKERRSAEYEKRNALEKRQRTRKYLREYLDPNCSFKPEVKPYEKIKTIMVYGGHDLDGEVIKRFVSLMSYSEFLQTPYWDGVRNYKLKKEGYRCQLCGKKSVLNVHHKTYEHHGEEHIRSIADEDLVVLCKDCHEKFHSKLGKATREA